MAFNLIYEEIGNRIKNLRKNRRLTQKQLAEQIHVSESALKKIENANRRPSLETVILLKETLRTSYDYLFWGKTEKSSSKDILSLIYQLPANEQRQLMQTLFETAIDKIFAEGH